MIYKNDFKVFLIALVSFVFVGIVSFVLLSNNVQEQARENFMTWKTTNSYLLQEGNYLRPFNNYTAMVHESRGLKGATLVNYKDGKVIAKLSFENRFVISDFVGRKFVSVPNGVFNFLAGGDVGGGYIVVFEYYSLDAVWIFAVLEIVLVFFIMCIAYFSYRYAKTVESRFHSLNLDKIRNVNAAARHDIKSVIGHLRGLYLLSSDSHHKNVLDQSCKRLSALSTINFTEGENSCPDRGQLFCISGVVKDLFREKFISWKAKNIKMSLTVTSECIGSLVECDYQQILRILSNIIDNAAESVAANRGAVDISISKDKEFVEISVCDNGPGILKSDLGLIGKKYFTTKDNGQGIALFYANQYLKSCSGQLSVQNRSERKGAKIVVSLKEVSNSLNLEKIDQICKKPIISIDDEKSVCEQLKIFISSRSNNEVEFLSTQKSTEFKNLTKKYHGSIALIDFDLGSDNPNGLDLAADVGSEAYPYILSNRFDDSEVLKYCLDKDIPFVPKNLYKEFLQTVV